MTSAPGQPSALVTVPNLLHLPVYTARDFARRSQLIAVGPDLDATAALSTATLSGSALADAAIADSVLSGTVVDQDPPAGTPVPRWSTVVLWTSGGPGDAGVREPRRPNPPPLSVLQHAEEPPSAPADPQPRPS